MYIYMSGLGNADSCFHGVQMYNIYVSVHRLNNSPTLPLSQHLQHMVERYGTWNLHLSLVLTSYRIIWENNLYESQGPQP